MSSSPLGRPVRLVRGGWTVLHLLPIFRIAGRLVAAIGRFVFTLGFLAAPLWIGAAVGFVSGSFDAAISGVFVASIVGCLGFFCHHESRCWALREHGRFRDRRMASRLRSGWPEFCDALNWAHGRAELGDRQEPILVGVRRDGDRLDVSWRPTADRAPARWAEDAEALRRAVGGHSVELGEPMPGVLLARVGMRPLPTRDVVNATAPVEAEPLDLGWLDGDAPALAVEPVAGFVLGSRAGGGQAVWVPAEVPHLLVTGTTGGGKGGTIRLLVGQALAAGWRVEVIDPKQSGEHRWLHDQGVTVAHALPGMVEVRRGAVAVMALRQAKVWDAGLDKVSELPEPERPLLVVIDEASDLFTLTRTDDEGDLLRREAGDLAARLAAKGRSAGVHLLVAMQRADVASLGPAGGALRSNIRGRVALGQLDPDGFAMIFPGVPAERGLALSGLPGRALVASLRTRDGSTPYSVQIMWVEPASLRAVA